MNFRFKNFPKLQFDGFEKAVEVDYVFVSHGHSENFSNSIPANYDGIIVCSNHTKEIIKQGQSIDETMFKVMKAGESFTVDDYTITSFDSEHIFDSFGWYVASRDYLGVYLGENRLNLYSKILPKLINLSRKYNKKNVEVAVNNFFLWKIKSAGEFTFRGSNDQKKVIIECIEQAMKIFEKLEIFISTRGIGKSELFHEIAEKLGIKAKLMSDQYLRSLTEWEKKKVFVDNPGNSKYVVHQRICGDDEKHLKNSVLKVLRERKVNVKFPMAIMPSAKNLVLKNYKCSLEVIDGTFLLLRVPYSSVNPPHVEIENLKNFNCEKFTCVEKRKNLKKIVMREVKFKFNKVEKYTVQGLRDCLGNMGSGRIIVRERKKRKKAISIDHGAFERKSRLTNFFTF